MNNILLVEDERHLAEGLQLNFTLEGFETRIATTIRSAKQLLQNETFKIIVLDISLPDGDGFELCEYIRHQNIITPILMLTARSLAEDKIKGLESGADDYLTKPFDLDELLARIRSILRRQQWNKQQPTVMRSFTFGTVFIDFDKHLITVGSDNVQLTALELELLRYFILNQDRVLSRKELLENVWKLNNYPNTRTVDNFIMRLRRLFEPTPDDPNYFLSIRGRGYKFTVK
jgi:DNA-binding response OmpR family regulator